MSKCKKTEEIYFYLNPLDRQAPPPDDSPSIGIISRADRNNVEVALQGSTAPIGGSEYSYLIPQKQIKELINNELSGNKE